MNSGSTVPAAGRRIRHNRLRNSREKFLELFRLNFRIISGTDTRAGNPFRGPGSDLVIVSLDTPVGERTFDALRETERGATIQDASKPERARLAGLPDWPGFDLLAAHPDGEVRSIEVKGRTGQGAIQMEANEWKQACHLGERYWLYVVFDCATPSPRLVRVRDPFAKLLANRRDESACNISVRSLLEAAEQTEPCVYAAPHDG